MCQESGVWSANESGDHFVFLHSTTSSHACLGGLSTLLSARSHTPPRPLYHPILAEVLWQRQRLAENPFPNSLNTDVLNWKQVDWTKGRWAKTNPSTDAVRSWRGQYGQVSGIYAAAAGIVFTPPGFMLGALTLALVSKLWNIRRWRYRRVCVVSMNELQLCGFYQQVAVQGHKTHALGTGEGAGGRVWTVFNLAAIWGTETSEEATARSQFPRLMLCVPLTPWQSDRESMLCLWWHNLQTQLEPKVPAGQDW